MEKSKTHLEIKSKSRRSTGKVPGKWHGPPFEPQISAEQHCPKSFPARLHWNASESGASSRRWKCRWWQTPWKTAAKSTEQWHWLLQANQWQMWWWESECIAAQIGDEWWFAHRAWFPHGSATTANSGKLWHRLISSLPSHTKPGWSKPDMNPPLHQSQPNKTPRPVAAKSWNCPVLRSSSETPGKMDIAWHQHNIAITRYDMVWYGGFLKWRYPFIDGFLHHVNHPFWGNPHLWKHRESIEKLCRLPKQTMFVWPVYPGACANCSRKACRFSSKISTTGFTSSGVLGWDRTQREDHGNAWHMHKYIYIFMRIYIIIYIYISLIYGHRE